MDDEVIVIGAGVIGVASARAMQAAGHKVRLVDPNPPGMACSFGNAGLIAIDQVLPLSRPDVLRRVPRMLLDPLSPLRLNVTGLPSVFPWLLRFTYACRQTQVDKGAAALGALLRQAMPAWERATRDFALRSFFRCVGTLFVFEHPQTRSSAGLEERYLGEHGVQFRMLKGKEVREYVPSILSSIAGARFFPDAGHVVDPHGLVVRLADGFVRSGGTIQKAIVSGFSTREGAVIGVQTSEGYIPASSVVLATGVRSQNLAKKLGVNAPLVAERGYHLMLEPNDVAPEVSLTFAERGFVVTPMNGGLRLAGTVELGARQQPDWRRADLLHRHMRELFPGKSFQESSRWFGDRPTLPDYLPMIGRSPRYSNAIFAFGHQHLGLTLAAITAELVSDLAANRKPQVDITSFSPTRFV